MGIFRGINQYFVVFGNGCAIIRVVAGKKRSPRGNSALFCREVNGLFLFSALQFLLPAGTKALNIFRSVPGALHSRHKELGQMPIGADTHVIVPSGIHVRLYVGDICRNQGDGFAQILFVGQRDFGDWFARYGIAEFSG